jgi:hypothetical protein
MNSVKVNEMKKAEVTKQDSGVKVTFTGAIEKQNVVSMVQRCQGGQCDCMSDENKQKMTGLAVSGEDGNVELEISGDLDVADIEAALEKSPLINDN